MNLDSLDKSSQLIVGNGTFRIAIATATEHGSQTFNMEDEDAFPILSSRDSTAVKVSIVLTFLLACALEKGGRRYSKCKARSTNRAIEICAVP